jgi:hypothetical protein
MSGQQMYCGIGKVPKGKVIGTPEYCIQTNQVRYYGLKKIDKKLLDKIKGPKIDPMRERLKLRKIQDEAKILVKEARVLKIILEDPKSKPSDVKRAQKRYDQLLVKKENLIKRLKKQQKVVDALED